MFTCQEPSTRLNMLGFGGCGVTKNLFLYLSIERYMKSQNQIIQRDLQIGVYQRAEAKLSQVSATRSGSCKRTEESPNIAREKAPGNKTTNMIRSSLKL